jgi:hypothetical protein
MATRYRVAQHEETNMGRTITLPVSAFSGTELALWCWLVFGAVAMALIPQARGMQSMVGWMPFWLVVAPLLDLAFVHRDRLLSTSRAVLVRARRRRRPSIQANRSRATRRLRVLRSAA